MFFNKNRIIMDEFESSGGFVAFRRNSSDFFWYRTVTGIIEDGFLYVDKRISKSGYYELPVKLLKVENIKKIVIKRYISLPLLILSILIITHIIKSELPQFSGPTDSSTDRSPLYIELILLCIFLFNIIRKRIIIKADKRYKWTAPFFSRKRSSEICSYVAHYCEMKDIAYRSYILPSQCKPSPLRKIEDMNFIIPLSIRALWDKQFREDINQQSHQIDFQYGFRLTIKINNENDADKISKFITQESYHYSRISNYENSHPNKLLYLIKVGDKEQANTFKQKIKTWAIDHLKVKQVKAGRTQKIGLSSGYIDN